MISAEITDPVGNRVAYSSAGRIARRTKFGIQRALFKIGKDLQSTFDKQVLDKSAKTGQIYIRRDRLGRGRKHQASAPGQSPANRTGFYRKSNGFNVNGSSELIFGNSAKYAEYLELGTSRMSKRPGLLNSIEANERNILRHLSTEIVDEA